MATGWATNCSIRPKCSIGPNYSIRPNYIDQIAWVYLTIRLDLAFDFFGKASLEKKLWIFEEKLWIFNFVFEYSKSRIKYVFSILKCKQFELNLVKSNEADDKPEDKHNNSPDNKEDFQKEEWVAIHLPLQKF